ncbi:MAG TPA: histidine kinase [Usitatibacter sp.]|nr:histidine kinase [Usitatibacter sp.]
MTAVALVAWPMMRIARLPGFSGFAEALRARAPVIFVLGVAISAMDLLRVWPLFMEAPMQVIASGTVAVMGQSMLSCFLVISAITLADRTRFGAAHRILAPGLAVLLAVPVATAAGTWLSTLGVGLAWIGKTDPSWWSLYFYLLWYALVVGLLSAAYFGTWERAKQSASDLRRAQLERQGMRQRMVESRLNVMKARVDPDFLFRMIGDVQRLYRSDVDAAEQRLEDFIDYLRAALPQMRGGATTLGEEVHLASAYVRLHDEAFEGRLEATFDVDEALAEAQFPPMALLPLVDDALRRASGSLALTITARRAGEGLVVAVVDDAGHEGETPALASHERAFVQFFGEGARVERRPGCVRLEIDHAIATRAHR